MLVRRPGRGYAPPLDGDDISRQSDAGGAEGGDAGGDAAAGLVSDAAAGLLIGLAQYKHEVPATP